MNKRIFVTSKTYNGNFDGVAGAHTECNDRAEAAGLGGTWSAFLSIKATSISQRIAALPGPWYRVDGELAFADKVAMTVGPEVPLVVDEYGNTITNEFAVWTGTGPNLDTIDSRICNAWKAGGVLYNGAFGKANAVNTDWVRSGSTGQKCSSKNRLYCIEH